MKKRENEPGDTTIEDIHRVRQEIWETFGGDMSAVVEHFRRRQAESDCETITLEESLRRNVDVSGTGR